MAKLPKDKRREQLLDVALTIVREQGADELTLGSLASCAGVSRPVTYEHFSTRAGLLIALYQRLEDRYVQALRDALCAAPQDLQPVADAISRAYFNCLHALGPEAPAISAALKGSEEMATQQRMMIHEYAEIMYIALRPFSPVADLELRLLCTGLLGAAESIARETHIGKIPEETAVGTLSSLIAKSIG